MSSCLQRDEALEKEDRIDEMKKKKKAQQALALRGLFGKFVEFGHKIFKYQYNPFILWNLKGGHL